MINRSKLQPQNRPVDAETDKIDFATEKSIFELKLRQAGALDVGLENSSGLENNDTHLRANACRCFEIPSSFPNQ